MSKIKGWDDMRTIGWNLFRFSILILNAGMLACCSFPNLLSSSDYDSEIVAEQKATISIRMTLSAMPEEIASATPRTVTSTPIPEAPCAYVWTLKQDDELSSVLSHGLPEVMNSEFEVGVAWYGENCINTNTNEVVRFSAKDMEITVFYAPHEIQTNTWMGEQIVDVVAEILPLLAEQPGIERFPVNLHFVFNHQSEQKFINFSLAKFKTLTDEQGLSGEALFLGLLE